MPLLIKGGRVITATDDDHLDIYCQGETITRLEANIDPASVDPDSEVIDATGRLVFPGFIDPHVHIHLPFMGTHARDDWASASRAALAGGTTTLIEMICPGPGDEPMAAFEDWHARAAGTASVDFTFHMAVVRFDDLAQKQLRQIVSDHGIASFKVFLAYKGALDLGDEDLFGCLQLAKELGVIVTAHCENAAAIDAMQAKLLSEGKTGPEHHEPSRPTCVETDGVTHLATLAQLTGAHIYCVHTSCDEAVNAALAARRRGVNIWIEAVAPHLVLDKTYAELPDFEGAKYVMSPPLRDKWNQAPLWNQLRARAISTIGTDHAPFDFETQKKAMGRDAFTKIPNGIPSVQERIDLIHTFGVKAGRLGYRAFVDACSTQAARIFGLYPRKGTIRVGSDADLVLYNPDKKHTLAHTTSHSNVDYNAFEGWEMTGKSELVTVRGKVQARGGQFVGETGTGQLLQRTPTHF